MPSATASTPIAGTPVSPSPTTAPKPTPTTAPVKTNLPAGPGTTEPGILLMASPLPDGSFDVAEIVHLATPTSSIWLGPPRLALAGSRFANAEPVASQVQVSAGNQPLMVPGGRVNQRTDLALNAPAKQIELRYNLSGVTLRSIPSRAGRALAAVSPLVGGVPNGLPVALMVSGSTVLNIECPVLRLRERALFHRTAAASSRQTEAAVAKRSDCCPVRLAGAAMSHGDAALADELGEE